MPTGDEVREYLGEATFPVQRNKLAADTNEAGAPGGLVENL
jgi:hypothetical protein